MLMFVTDFIKIINILFFFLSLLEKIMAARANLTLDETLKAAFISAQESRLIRIIKVQIVAEVLTLHSTIQRVSTSRHDFDLVLAPSLASNEAIFVLFCTTEEIAETNTLGLYSQQIFFCLHRSHLPF